MVRILINFSTPERLDKVELKPIYATETAVESKITPFLYAVSRGKLEIATHFVAQGADVNEIIAGENCYISGRSLVQNTVTALSAVMRSLIPDTNTPAVSTPKMLEVARFLTAQGINWKQQFELSTEKEDVMGVIFKSRMKNHTYAPSLSLQERQELLNFFLTETNLDLNAVIERGGYRNNDYVKPGLIDYCDKLLAQKVVAEMFCIAKTNPRPMTAMEMEEIEKANLPAPKHKTYNVKHQKTEDQQHEECAFVNSFVNSPLCEPRVLEGVMSFLA
jgi:hypothetical protein